MVRGLVRLEAFLRSKGLVGSSYEVRFLVKHADASSLARALRDAQKLENSKSPENRVNYKVPGGITEWTEELEESFKMWMTSMKSQGHLPGDRAISSYYADPDGDGKQTLRQEELNSLLEQPSNQPRTTTVQVMTKMIKDKALDGETGDSSLSVAPTTNAAREVPSQSSAPAMTNKQRLDKWMERLNSGEFNAGRLIGEDPTGEKARDAAAFQRMHGHDEIAGKPGQFNVGSGS